MSGRGRLGGGRRRCVGGALGMGIRLVGEIPTKTCRHELLANGKGPVESLVLKDAGGNTSA
jgi:hypothetical protein